MILETADHRYTKAEVLDLRASVIELRDSALKQAMMSWAVSLSHVIALLSLIGEQIDE